MIITKSKEYKILVQGCVITHERVAISYFIKIKTNRASKEKKNLTDFQN